MKLCHTCLILMILWAIPSLAEDASTVLAAQPSVTTTNQPAKNGTNEVTEPEVPGRNFTNSMGMELIKVPGDFWAGKFEVTQKEYEKVMGANPSAFTDDSRPVDSVSWNDAIAFCEKITALDLKKRFLPKGYRYTLPTEEEWQSLVADASLDDAVSSLYAANRVSSSPVGSLAPNSLGLYDVRGNVMEFCLGDDTLPYRYLKGGSWHDFIEVNLRPEFRWNCRPDETMNTFGFRCLLKSN